MILSLSIPTERQIEAHVLPELIAAYIAATKPNVTAKVLQNYQYHLNPFLLWWQKFSDQHQQTLSKSTLQLFVDWYAVEYRTVTGLQTSDHMMDQTLSILRRVLRWSGVTEDDANGVVPVHPSHPKPKYYPKIEELDRLIKAPSEPHLALRDMTIMAMLLATGCRRFELANATVENVHFNTSIYNLSLGDDHGGYVHLRVVKGDAAGKGQGRYSMFHWKAGLLLKAYLRLTRRSSGTLFGLSDDGIRTVVNEAGKDSGITRIHPHAFRSAFIDYWFWKYQDGGEAADIARHLQVGHALDKSNISTHYINLNMDRQLELIKRFYVSPLEEIALDWYNVPVSVAEGQRHL